MAPFYVGLIAALVALMVVFFQELVHEIPMLWTFDRSRSYAMTADDAIMLALSLIDLSLAANLVLIVMFSGYENFVSKIDMARPRGPAGVDGHGRFLRPQAEAGRLDRRDLGHRAAESPSSSSARASDLTPLEEKQLMWQVIVHVMFVVSGVLLALMDWLTGHQKG